MIYIYTARACLLLGVLKAPKLVAADQTLPLVAPRCIGEIQWFGSCPVTYLLLDHGPDHPATEVDGASARQACRY